jgi:hypothetical protein
VGQPKVVRPEPEFFESDRFEELQQFLIDHWERAVLARQEQVDEKYRNWQRNYEAIPAVHRRTLPWPGASNFVVPLTRMFIDTFVARTLNIVFATRPLYTLDFLPREVKESTEEYLNRKAVYDWEHYLLTRELLQRGAKNGTVVTKTPWVVDEEYDVSMNDADQMEEELITVYSGPKTTAIPFEDFYLYPITVNRLEEATILFHRIRFVEEEAKRRALKWNVSDTEIDAALEMPTDIKRDQVQADSGVQDPWLKELHLVECHLRFPLTNDANKYYNVIALLEPRTKKLFDVYYNPYPRNLRIFQDYRPSPREDFFYGESWCQILQQSQEEASTIHNDRRNNSYIANAPIFKRRSSSLLPNPSTSWYPGKVWDLEDMADFEVVMLGRNYNDMLAEENHSFMLAERLIGIGAVMQGNAAGMMGKRGIYNAAGTLAVLSESNQRQDTNIRDIRQVLGAVGKIAFTLQRQYGTDDPVIDMFPEKVAGEIRKGLQSATPDLLRKNYFEIKASDAGANSEVAKANLLQMAQTVGQYSASVPQLATQLMAVSQNPVMSQLLMQVAQMNKWMAVRLMRAFDEFDGTEFLPDIAAAFNRGAEGAVPPGATPGPSQVNQRDILGGGASSNGVASARGSLESISQIPLPPI